MRVQSILALLVFTLLAPQLHAEVPEDNWPTWRGPTSNGMALKGNPPIQWSETENIKWKVPIAGSGSSTPIIWGNKLFLQTAIPVIPEGATPKDVGGSKMSTYKKVPHKFSLVCIDRSNGKLLWERVVSEETPHEGHHPTANYASYSPVTDGKLLWVSFGSRGLYCFDLDGTLKWSTDLMHMKIRMGFGESSSPVLAGDAIVVLMDHEGDSKIVAFNKITGKPLWETPREEDTSWSSPTAVQVGDTLQIVTTATKFIRSYDAKTGKLIWKCSGLTMGAIPTPVTGFGNVYCASAFRGDSLMAIKLDNTGDISESDAITWHLQKGAPYIPSPLLYDDKLYFITNMKGLFNCFDAKTGEPFYVSERLSGVKQVYASPLGVAGRIYVADRSGKIVVIKHSTTFEVLAENKLDEGFDASPVSVGDELYLRGEHHLYCIAKS